MSQEQLLDSLRRGGCPTHGELAYMCNNGEIDSPRFVDSYHIDSQAGLNLFVKKLHEHNLVKGDNGNV